MKVLIFRFSESFWLSMLISIGNSVVMVCLVL